ncbi:MAG: FMN-binding protein [Rectinemataceae bacterium]|nr:FMN-binding protein [Rectinemataceae bacterium]
MKGIAKLGFVLALFAVAACASLAVVYAITKPQIEAQDQIALTASLKELFPEGETFEDISASVVSDNPEVKFQSAMLAKSAAAPLGVAIKASGASYGGQATLLVGVQLNRSIAGVRVLELNDTAGLGANAKNEGYYVNKAEKITFPGQFSGKFVTDPFEVKNDVVAITASTITSKALTRIVKSSADAAVLWLENSTIAGGK